MKKISIFLVLLFLTIVPVIAQDQCDDSRYGIASAVKTDYVAYTGEFKGKSLADAKELIIYLDKGSKENNYVPSGWIGDYGDVTMDDGITDNPHSGANCIKFIYTGKKSQGQGWAGVYWQSSANNWGSKVTGLDLSNMTKITFWARGENGGEVIQKFMVGGIKGKYSDSTEVVFGPVTLTKEWKEYTINLSGKNLAYINGGFGWVVTSDLDPQGCIFYVDDIKFVADPTVKAEGRLAEEMPFYVYSDKNSANNHFIASGWMGDYGDIKYDAASTDMPFSGDTCIKINYCACGYQGARWAGMYWQNPANNWGEVDGGYNLSKATKLTFWARGKNGGEIIDDFKVGGISGKFADTDAVGTGPITLKKEWTQYTIDLAGKKLSNIIGGFCWVANMDNNPKGVDFYLDDIKFE
ncbi:MAG: hypothetical protein PHP17_01840 [Candidatus Omnitrophica bacterium]|nr:hypothetical protein [Candidatus Omnitrophota bacterium]